MTTAAQQARYRKRHPEKCREIVNRCNRKDSEVTNEKAREWRRKTGYYRLHASRIREKHPHKKAAWDAVYLAVKSGHLVRPSVCEQCGLDCKPQAHHPDYLKKLEVIWLCRRCHLAVDGKEPRVVRDGDSQV